MFFVTSVTVLTKLGVTYQKISAVYYSPKKYDLSFQGEYYKKGRLKDRHLGRGGGRLGPKGIVAKGRFHRIDQERKLQLGEGRKRIIGALKMSLIWSLLFFY